MTALRCHFVGSARAGAAFHIPRPKGPLISRSTSVVFGVLTFLSVLSGAQTDLLAQARTGRPAVFLDCNGRDCNSQYYRTEIDWVDWVNVREAADVHLIFTSVATVQTRNDSPNPRLLTGGSPHRPSAPGDIG